MPFIIPDSSSDVISVNDKKGQVILDYDDVGAVANIMDSCNGIQIGTANERPSSAKNNVLYVMTDITPNRFYRYSTGLGDWELIGGSGDGGGGTPTGVIAIDVSFNNNGTILDSGNVQNAILELSNMIEDNQEDLIQVVEKNEGKVKLNILDNADYLENKIDNITLQIERGKVVVKGLDGLNSTIRELNYLRNAKSNIQGQIDSLSSVGNFAGAVNTRTELDDIESPNNKDMVIVIEDETQNGKSTIYMYGVNDWEFVGDFTADIRDLATQPVELEREITGILSEANIDSSIARKSDLQELMKNTDEVEEGSNNLYYTDNRVSSNIDVKNNKRARHTHDNKTTIDKLSENVAGKLLFDGKLIEGESGVGSVNWEKF